MVQWVIKSTQIQICLLMKYHDKYSYEAAFFKKSLSLNLLNLITKIGHIYLYIYKSKQET